MVLSEFGRSAKHQVIIWLSWSCPKTLGQDYFFYPHPTPDARTSLTKSCLEFHKDAKKNSPPRDSLHECLALFFTPTSG